MNIDLAFKIEISLKFKWILSSNTLREESDRRTRTGYRNKMKKEAFEFMGEVSSSLQIHDAVLKRAKEE